MQPENIGLSIRMCAPHSTESRTFGHPEIWVPTERAINDFIFAVLVCTAPILRPLKVVNVQW